MKKYILGIIVIIAAFFTITNVYAENEYPDSGWEIPTIKGEVVIKWRIMEIETITDQTK